MTDLSLNSQLSARLCALQEYWGHDSPSETLALIFDCCIHKWGITPPHFLNLNAAKTLRIKLKSRHLQYFSKCAELSGCTVSEVARSVLIQWICSQSSTLSLPAQTQIQPSSTPLLPKSKKTQPSSTRKKSTPKKDKSVQSSTPSVIEDNIPQPLPSPEKVNSKFNARESLLALKNK